MEYDKQITDFENLNSAQITFTNSFVQYNENQTLENYINLKSAHSDFEFYKLKFLTNYPVEMVTIFKNEILSNVITTKVPQFESVEKFEKVILDEYNKILNEEVSKQLTFFYIVIS